MLTEEKPEEFASPEQNHENGSKKKKKKKKKKNNETLPQSNEHPQPQVSSEPSLVTPISEFKSNQEESNEPKPSLDATELENKKEVEKIEVCEEFGETGSGKIKKKRKKKSKSEKEKIGDVVVVENALNHDSEQVNSTDRRKRQKCVQDGVQSNEHNVEPAETAVQESVVDREVPPVDSTIRLNNHLNSENEHNVGPVETAVQISVVDREVSQVDSTIRLNNQPNSENEHVVESAETAVQISVVDREVSEVDSTIRLNNQLNGENEHVVEPAETAVQISVVDREVSQVDSTIRLNNQLNSENEHVVEPAETAVPISVLDREVSQEDSTIRLNNQLNSENEHNVGPAETVVQISVLDREVSQVNSEPLVVTPISEFKSNEEAYAEFAKTQTGEIKKNKKKKKKSVINGEESNEPKLSLDATVSTEFENKKEGEKREVYTEFGETQTGEIKKKKKKKKCVINGEESNEPKPSLDATVSTEFENKKEGEKSEVYTEFGETQTGKIKKKKKKKKCVINGEESNEPKPSLDVTVSTEFENKKQGEKSEVYTEIGETQTGEIKKKKKKKKCVINGEESNEPKPSLDATVSTEFENKKQGEKSEVYTEVAETQTGEIKKKKKKKCVINGEESNEPKPSSDATVSTEFENKKQGEKSEVYTEFAKTQTGEIKKKKKKKSVINGEESNEPKPSLDATVSTEFENQTGEKRKRKSESEGCAEFAKTQKGEKRKRKSESETGKMVEVVDVENVLNDDSEQVNEIFRSKRQKSMQDGEQSNEHNVEPAETVVQISVVDREVSPEDPTIRLNNQPANLVEQKDERKIRHEKHLELMKLQKLVEEERKRLTKENVLNHDSEQVNEIVWRKRQDGAQPNEHNVEPAETVVQISVADREVFPVDPTIRLNNQPANLAEQMNKRKIRQEKNFELLKMHKFVKEEKKRLVKEIEGPLTRYKIMKINQALESLKTEYKEKMREKGVDILSNGLSVSDERNKNNMQAESKDELKTTGEEKNKMQAESKDELKSTGVEKTNSEICCPCRGPNHSIKQCRKPRPLSKDEEVCFFCGEIGHSLGKCSVYKAAISENKMQVESKDELKSTGVEKTNSEICWACREPNHSIKQCRKLRSLSKDEEVCFFCGEIGHSLGKCSVYKAGGGRLARCLFCNLHGHFSSNCPGHSYFQGAVAGGS